ncbi:MAG: hypothetical protein ACLFM0_03325 [Spirochaetales bacterium]
MDNTAIALGVELVVGAIATFLAILLWSRTRDIAWMFVVIGTIVHYASVVFEGLAIVGVLDLDTVMVAEVSVGRVVLAAAPMTFFVVAFAIMLSRKIP